jgi:C1A family cysteine protease
MKRKYGYIPDKKDNRDILYKVTAPIQLPPLVDLRALCPPVFDQGQLGSCTANAIAASFMFEEMKQKSMVFQPSRLFIYYNERVIEGTVRTDAGAMIRDGFKSIKKQGVCNEITWPYDIKKFKTKPVLKCYAEALKHQALQYQSVMQTLTDMKTCLAEGYPFVFGFSVYESFESAEVAKTGIVPMPGRNEQQMGGHAVMAVGYDDANRMFIVRNSWGATWGQDGYFKISYDYLTNPSLANDFWTIRLIES